MEDLKEKNFEADIEQWLLNEGGYTKGDQRTYDKERAIDMATLTQFLALTQPKQWERYMRKYGDKAENRLYQVFQENVVRYGLIWVLRNGIDDLGIKLRMCYFRPASELNDELMLKYQQNILQVTRQFAYSTQNRNTIDMVLSLNGIPVVALELKNQFTGQNVENSRHQWKNDRDPAELLFHPNTRILAYFGVDLYEAIMATELKKEKTFFMPFNQGSGGAGNVGGAGNPESEDGDYATSYLWKRVLRRDMLLSILQRYISRQEEEKIRLIRDKHGKIKEKKDTSTKIIFPRYHQLDVVEKLIADTEAKGSGQNYLIQHSAGSGKSNSIAWLTYRLASLHDAHARTDLQSGRTEYKDLQSAYPLFDAVFVITDRRVLNAQLQSTILGFDHIEGQIETITDKDPSTKLRDVINEGAARIVICTLHRFPVIYQEVTSRSGKHYAIIVDEAHSSQSGKSAEKVKTALADTDEALREMAELEEKTEEELEKERDSMMEDLLAQGKHANLSFYAFTATPKPKTLQTFGVPITAPTDLQSGGFDSSDLQSDNTQYRPFHIYSMLQAIEEGFIKDVLLQYTPYSVTYEIEKRIAQDPTYEETPATKAVKAYHDNHQHVINQKTEIIVEKFRQITLHAMKGQAKAMVVTSSRAHALRYFMQIKKYCEEKGYVDVHPMVAFSGKVQYEDTEYTETKLNSTADLHISEERLPLYFSSDMYNMLVVADKYLTGFDEPLLHTMFVDKKLKNVKAVQTLSRLNRAHKDKEDTYVLDFVNAPEDIKHAFEPFYTATELIRPVDVNGVYNFRNDIAQHHLWNPTEEEAIYQLAIDRCSDCKSSRTDKNRLAKLSNAFKPIVARFEQLDEETRFKVRSLIKNFVRFYAYIAQVERTYDRSLYKTYVFCDLLYRLLPKTPHEKVDLNKQIQLINSRIEEGRTQAIVLDKGKGGIKGENVKGGGKPDENKDLLSNIIDKVNLMFKGNFSPADRVIVEAIYDKLSTASAKKKLTKQAKNNDPKQFAESIFPEIFERAAQQCYDDSVGAFDRLFQNRELYNSIMTQMADLMYQNYRAEGDTLIFNPERFKQKIIPTIEREFSVFRMMPKGKEQIAEDLVTIIAAKTIDDIDGANDVIQNAFNRLYCSPAKVPLVDKKQHFNTLVSRFEVFLKKVYYIKNHSEIVSTKPGQEGMKATLADCIFQTPCLKRLKYSDSEADKKFSDYLNMVRDWRNDQAHKAPTATEEECDLAINVLTTMYLFVVAFGIRKRDLEQMDGGVTGDIGDERLGMAAESLHDE
ncbi:MAG: type I restriction endonuclease subunit R [Prevotella sp.]|nr:type I restriction endonuclease subunit R [Prevotella sp.]